LLGQPEQEHSFLLQVQVLLAVLHLLQSEPHPQVAMLMMLL